MSEPAVLRTAEFDEKVQTYYMVSTLLIFFFTIIGIPLLPIAWLVGRALIGAYIDRMSCVLTERTLELRKGILTRTESTIPLEKITDLHMFQGPIMRWLGIHGFKVETAGQTTMAGALLSIVGIVDAPAFRKAVLAQRDAREDARQERPAAGPDGSAATATSLATAADSEVGAAILELRDAVVRIERQLASDAPSRGGPSDVG